MTNADYQARYANFLQAQGSWTAATRTAYDAAAAAYTDTTVSDAQYGALIGNYLQANYNWDAVTRAAYDTQLAAGPQAAYSAQAMFGQPQPNPPSIFQYPPIIFPPPGWPFPYQPDPIFGFGPFDPRRGGITLMPPMPVWPYWPSTNNPPPGPVSGSLPGTPPSPGVTIPLDMKGVWDIINRPNDMPYPGWSPNKPVIPPARPTDPGPRPLPPPRLPGDPPS